MVEFKHTREIKITLWIVVNHFGIDNTDANDCNVIENHWEWKTLLHKIQVKSIEYEYKYDQKVITVEMLYAFKMEKNCSIQSDTRHLDVVVVVIFFFKDRLICAYVEWKSMRSNNEYLYCNEWWTINDGHHQSF